ncbi:MAG: hypothetical protein ACE5JX_06800 [Acidobacteriota bacterium]
MLEKTLLSEDDDRDQLRHDPEEPGDRLEQVRRQARGFLAKGEAAVERALADPIPLEQSQQPGAQ